MMGFARFFMGRHENLTFWKLLGSGSGQGFTPKPNWGVYAILCVWTDRPSAELGLSKSLFGRYRSHASEHYTVFMAPFATRGQWSGREPFQISHPPVVGPVAVMTRATLKPRAIPKFWKMEPFVSALVGQNESMIFKIGLGEKPFLQQMTFSIWPDLAPMVAFARGCGAHADAISQVRAKDMFAEELYARFAITGSHGSWSGCDPLG